MADYLGAKAAMRQRFQDAWGNTTPIATQNKSAPSGWPGVWPPVVGGVIISWVYLEILASGATLASATGTTGNRLWAYEGDINVHVFVPVGDEDDGATELALQAGEIFRAAKFYEGPDGRCIRTLAPLIEDGGSASDDGNWFVVTMSVPFTYWHRG